MVKSIEITNKPKPHQIGLNNKFVPGKIYYYALGMAQALGVGSLVEK